MSRKLKRVLHVGERRIGNNWVFDRAFYLGHSLSSRAKRYVEVFPEERRHVVYGRDEWTTHPGTSCLWVVERQQDTGWEFIEVCGSVEQRDRVLAITRGKTRFLRFVRWRVCK